MYNTQGNPTVYKGISLVWLNGLHLTRYNATTFEYDGLGRRTSKGSIKYTYDTDGRLIAQSNGLEFVYDAQGIAGVKYNGQLYLYRKDAQGNITGILDSNGNVVVKYIYDAWGNHAVVDSNGNDIESGIGALNPYRYCGYYYDTETELYYLQTRYYDPETGRFISRDGIEYAEPESINGINLYVYCGNNPVMNIDPMGTDWKVNVKNWFRKIGKKISRFATNAWSGVTSLAQTVWAKTTNLVASLWNSAYNLTKNTVKRASNWWSNIAYPQIENFFTYTVPKFFKETVWENWIVDKVWNKGLKPFGKWVDEFYDSILSIVSIIVSFAGAILSAIPVTAHIGLVLTAVGLKLNMWQLEGMF